MTTHLTCPNGAPSSRFAFGTMQFGGRADAKASQELFETSRTAGINHFDTAWVYTDGQSELLLGQMIKSQRDQLLIASKVGYQGGAGRANILAQFDTIRQRLQEDTVDLLYMHRFDPDTPLDETFETLADLQTRGQIRYIGGSNYAAWQVMKAQAVAARFDTKIDAIQPMYNLVKRQAEVELLPMCTSEGITPIPYSPLGGGLLTGKYSSGGSGRLSEDERYAARYGQTQMHQSANDLTTFAQDLGHSPATLAVAWAAHHPSRPVPILSARSVDQLEPSLKGMELQLNDDIYKKLSALSPAPAPATDRLEEA